MRKPGVHRQEGWQWRFSGSAASGPAWQILVAELGFAVASGVLLDTLVVRSVLVTALNLDLGRWIWWPSRLYRQATPQIELPNGRATTVR